MSANCNYLYTTDGSRWEGGSIAVTMMDDKTTRVGPDDISRLRKEFGRKAVIRVFCVTKDGERIPMRLDLARAKGRAGRREKQLDGTYIERLRVAGYTEERTAAVLKEQLRTLPYGEKNADAAIERMKVALEVLEHGTVARMLAGLEAPHLITMLARACATGTYSPPTPYRGASFGRSGLSSLDALVIRSLLPMAQATLDLEGIPLKPLERALELVESTPVIASTGLPRIDPNTSLSVDDLLEMCDDIDVLSLVSSAAIPGRERTARLAKRRFEEVYAAKYGGPGPDPSEYTDLPEWLGAAGRHQRRLRQRDS